MLLFRTSEEVSIQRYLSTWSKKSVFVRVLDLEIVGVPCKAIGNSLELSNPHQCWLQQCSRTEQVYEWFGFWKFIETYLSSLVVFNEIKAVSSKARSDNFIVQFKNKLARSSWRRLAHLTQHYQQRRGALHLQDQVTKKGRPWQRRSDARRLVPSSYKGKLSPDCLRTKLGRSSLLPQPDEEISVPCLWSATIAEGVSSTSSAPRDVLQIYNSSFVLADHIFE